MNVERMKKTKDSLVEFYRNIEQMPDWLQERISLYPETEKALREVEKDVNQTSLYLTAIIHPLIQRLCFQDDENKCGRMDALAGLVWTFNAILANYDWWRYIHPEITAIAQPLYKDGYYTESVTKALVHINERLQTAYKEQRNCKTAPDGDNLINQMFSGNTPILLLSSPNPESQKNMQNGVRDMLKGAWEALRNPSAHQNITISADEAVRRLMFASMLLYMIDDAKPPEK